MKMEHFFWENVKLVKFSMESKKFLEIGRKSKTGGNASLPQGDGCPEH